MTSNFIPLIRRIDRDVVEVLVSTNLTYLYQMDLETQKWVARDVEGATVIYKRKEAPLYKLIILNKKSTDNFIVPFENVFDYEVIDRNIMFTRGNGELYNMMFMDAPSTSAFVKVLNSIWLPKSKPSTEDTEPELLEEAESEYITLNHYNPQDTVSTSDKKQPSSDSATAEWKASASSTPTESDLKESSSSSVSKSSVLKSIAKTQDSDAASPLASDSAPVEKPTTAKPLDGKALLKFLKPAAATPNPSPLASMAPVAVSTSAPSDVVREALQMPPASAVSSCSAPSSPFSSSSSSSSSSSLSSSSSSSSPSSSSSSSPSPSPSSSSSSSPSPSPCSKRPVIAATTKAEAPSSRRFTPHGLREKGVNKNNASDRNSVPPPPPPPPQMSSVPPLSSVSLPDTTTTTATTTATNAPCALHPSSSSASTIAVACTRVMSQEGSAVTTSSGGGGRGGVDTSNVTPSDRELARRLFIRLLDRDGFIDVVAAEMKNLGMIRSWE